MGVRTSSEDRCTSVTSDARLRTHQLSSEAELSRLGELSATFVDVRCSIRGAHSGECPEGKNCIGPGGTAYTPVLWRIFSTVLVKWQGRGLGLAQEPKEHGSANCCSTPRPLGVPGTVRLVSNIGFPASVDIVPTTRQQKIDCGCRR